MELPEFDGATDFGTFLTKFMLTCQVKDVTDPWLMKAVLIGKLTGAADSFLEGRHADLAAMTF